MAATWMDGAALAAKIRASVKEEIAELGGLGLATVLVGDDPASHLYISRKHEAAVEVGIEPFDYRLPADTSEEELLDLLRELNDDEDVDGILPQLPLPEGIDEARVIRAVDPGVAERAAYLTPVPGGVGPVTIAMLLRNTVLAARYRRGTLAFPRV